MSNTTYLNPGSLAPSKEVSTDDRPDYLVFSVIYDLPAGRGKHFLANANRVVIFVLGNWQVAGEYTYYQGAPLIFGDVIYNGQPLNLNAHDANGAVFNTAVFNTISSQQLASNYRAFPAMVSNLRVDRMKNINVNMTKSFTIHENLKMQFRAEAFNLSNWPLFDTPSLTPTSSTFGFITDPPTHRARSRLRCE